MMYGAIDGILVAGFTAFGPKYFENEFNMDASLAGTLFGKAINHGKRDDLVFRLGCKSFMACQRSKFRTNFSIVDAHSIC